MSPAMTMHGIAIFFAGCLVFWAGATIGALCMALAMAGQERAWTRAQNARRSPAPFFFEKKKQKTLVSFFSSRRAP